MANDSINDVVLLKQIVKKSKKLRNSLEKASALMRLGLENDAFLTYPQIDIYFISLVFAIFLKGQMI